MKIFFDTEFHENGRTIELISIGMVREDGATLYLEAEWYDVMSSTPWLCEHVLPYLTGPRVQPDEMRKRIVEFAGPKPEFWAYYASYDWVVLCQLFGTMMDLPKHWPMFCRDIMQLKQPGQKLPQLDAEDDDSDGTKHNALSDALWNKIAYEVLIASAQQPDSRVIPSQPHDAA